MFRIIVIYLVLLLHVLDTSVANLALVRIARDLQIEIFQSQWIVTSFGVGVGIAISLAGRLSAWAGERTVLTLALVGSALASFGCGLADGFVSLVAMRALHGLASGLVIIVGQKVLVEIAGPERKAFGLSLWSSAMAIAPVLGPVAGAQVIEHLSWRWVFWLNVPLVSLAILALHSELDVVATRKGPPPALLPPLFLGVLLTCLEVLIDVSFEPASSSPLVLGGAIGGLVASVVALAVYTRLRGESVFEWRLLRNSNYLAFTTVAVLANGLILSTSVTLPVWLQLDYGLPLRLVANVVAAGGIIAGVLSPILGRVKAKQLYPFMVVSALGLLCLSFALTARLETGSTMTELIVPRLVLGLALSLFSPWAYLSIAKLPDKDFIAANGLSMFLRAAIGNVILATSTGLLRRLDTSYLEELVARGGASWFHLDVPVPLGATVSVASTSSDTRSMQTFFAVAAALCLLLFAVVVVKRTLDAMKRT
jgi:DHA2 family multidrug resistance protein